jgi:broad specificity phosphatase PhoE
MASRFLYLVRHGEAAGEEGSLTAAGQEQARLTGPGWPQCHWPPSRTARAPGPRRQPG